MNRLFLCFTDAFGSEEDLALRPPSGVLVLQLMLVVQVALVVEILGDFEASREATGAYGTSSTSSATMKLTSVQTDAQVNQNYMNILNEKDHGVPLRTVSTYYIFTQKIKLKAAEKDIREALPADKVDAWKAFLKTNKIKWKNPQSVLAVVDFLSNY